MPPRCVGTEQTGPHLVPRSTLTQGRLGSQLSHGPRQGPAPRPGLLSLLCPQRMMARAVRLLQRCRSHSNGESAGPRTPTPGAPPPLTPFPAPRSDLAVSLIPASLPAQCRCLHSEAAYPTCTRTARRRGHPRVRRAGLGADRAAAAGTYRHLCRDAVDFSRPLSEEARMFSQLRDAQTGLSTHVTCGRLG